MIFIKMLKRALNIINKMFLFNFLFNLKIIKIKVIINLDELAKESLRKLYNLFNFDYFLNG